MRPRLALACLPVVACAASCDFDSAFDRYCKGNPNCAHDDASMGRETSSSPETNPGPETTSGPEAGGAPDAAPDAGPDASMGPETGFGPDGFPGRDFRDGDGGPTISPPRSCVQNGDCNPDEVCHPFGQVCMRKCNSRYDCPLLLDACSEIRDPSSGAALTPRVCQCSMAQSCNVPDTGLLCHPVDNLCERRCAATQECASFQPPRVCDLPSGLCQTGAPSCASNRDCPSATQPRCDPTALRCVGCVTAADCASRPDGLTSCSASGACVSSP